MLTDGRRELVEVDSVQVGSRLRGMRQAKGLSLNEVARRAGVSGGNLSRIERGEYPLWTSYLVRIARVLGDEVYSLAEPGLLIGSLRDLAQAEPRPDLAREARTLLSAAAQRWVSAEAEVWLLPGGALLVAASGGK